MQIQRYKSQGKLMWAWVLLVYSVAWLRIETSGLSSWKCPREWHQNSTNVHFIGGGGQQICSDEHFSRQDIEWLFIRWPFVRLVLILDVFFLVVFVKWTFILIHATNTWTMPANCRGNSFQLWGQTMQTTRTYFTTYVTGQLFKCLPKQYLNEESLRWYLLYLSATAILSFCMSTYAAHTLSIIINIVPWQVKKPS